MPRELTAERLREVLSYDPQTGDFRWLVSRRNHRARVGDIAGYTDPSIEIGIDGFPSPTLAYGP